MELEIIFISEVNHAQKNNATCPLSHIFKYVKEMLYLSL